ncbi:MAG: M6 family metalloprotease domain-containing protein [Kiritimatiellae bacterium]|nr:M6 family metalloprotease domain-containing protein [Kiritimatiellia bacterium]
MRNEKGLFFLRTGLAVALSTAASAFAAPFDKWFEHRAPDGRIQRIHGEGDEYGARFEDEEGRNLVYDPATGAYEYAEPEDEAALRGRAEERRREKAEETGLAARWAALKARRAEAADEAAAAGGALKAPPSSKTEGTIVGVTLLVDFPLLDGDGNETNTLAAVAHPDVTADDLREFVNGTGFSKYGNASSVREYYAEATSGHVDYTNVVVGWIKAPYPREHYDVASKDNGTCGRALIGDVFDAIAGSPAFLSDYLPALVKATANADGEFLALNVLFAGPEATTWSYGLWAHQWVLSSAQYDKLKITVGSKSYHFRNYQISPVTASPSIHTFCHESAHMICDFPDLYAYSTGLGNGVGNWCLMCGRTDDRHPQNFCAYLRAAAGWVAPKTLPSESGAVSVAADLQDVWKFPHPTDKKQYYLIENRQAAGRDRELRASGIVIYRCDESGDNTTGARTGKAVFSQYGFATNRLSYEVSVEQADGLYEIERDVRGKYNGDPCDTWYDGNGAGLYAAQFNAVSVPCARWTDGTAAKINLSAFSENGGTMTFWNEVADSSAVEPEDLASAIYVNGISTATHCSYEKAGEATYWRVTDGRIVLRGSGPYAITGTGTTPIRCALTDDAYTACNVSIRNLSVRSSDDAYGAFDCGSKDVNLAFSGTNVLRSVAASEKKSYPAIRVKSGVTLAVSGAEDALLECTGGKYAAGIGGGYSKGLLSTGDNDAGSVRVLGGTIRARGGYNGAGIGGGNGGTLGRVDVYDAVVEAVGGTGAAGIGGGYKGSSGHFFNYGATVWATGGLGDGSTPDIGRGADSTSKLAHRFYASGGSTELANGYVTGMTSPSNATERVYRTVVGGLVPGMRCTFAELPDGYRQDRLVADANGEVHLWLPSADYSFVASVDGDAVDFTATVAGGKTTATGSSDYGRWLHRHGFLDHDLPTWRERAAFAQTPTPLGKRGAGGTPLTVFDEYVAGTEPGDADDLFRADIAIGEDGRPVVGWFPDLNEGGARSIREYTVHGAEAPSGPWHTPVTDADRFFKVSVSLPQ